MARQKRYPIFTRLHSPITAIREGRGDREHRRRLLEGLSGRVIEVGAGIGANFDRYPSAVEEVVAIEPDPYLRARAVRAATATPIKISVIDGDAHHLPAADGSFSAGVVSLLLCTVPDPQHALTELFRVIQPDGELRFYEHVISDSMIQARWQRIADATFWPHVIGGCHLSRDTITYMEQAGFQLQTCERFPFSLAFYLPSDPHVLGVARRP